MVAVEVPRKLAEIFVQRINSVQTKQRPTMRADLCHLSTVTVITDLLFPLERLAITTLLLVHSMN